MPNLNGSLLLINANARGGDIDIDEIAKRLSPVGPLVSPVCTDAESLCDAIIEHSGMVRRVLIFGGDGTLNAALPALLSDALCIRPQSLLRLMAYGPSMRSGNLVDDANIKTFSGRKVVVVTRRAVDVTADGELVTRTPAECHVLPGALKVFVPVE